MFSNLKFSLNRGFHSGIILLFIISFYFYLFSGCSSSEDNTELLKVKKDYSLNDRSKKIKSPEKEVTYNDCTDNYIGTSTAACVEPHCSCPYGYSRHDLDPCEYSNMYDYGQAVVCELNRISTNCSFPGLPYGCTEMELCIKGLDVPADYLQNHPHTTPWKYCSDADDCETWTCTGGIFDIAIHIYLSTDDQDILVDYAWDLAWDNRPTCANSFPAIPYAVYFKICANGNYATNCYNESSVFCANKDIRLHILYKCCSLE